MNDGVRPVANPQWHRSRLRQATARHTQVDCARAACEQESRKEHGGRWLALSALGRKCLADLASSLCIRDHRLRGEQSAAASKMILILVSQIHSPDLSIPYGCMDDLSIRAGVMSGDIHPKVGLMDGGLQAIIRQCWDLHAEDRPKFSLVVKLIQAMLDSREGSPASTSESGELRADL